MTLDDMDLFEVNEAFASVVLSWAQQTGADLEQDQRQRRRDRAGSPGRLDRHPPDHHGPARARATRPDPRTDLACAPAARWRPGRSSSGSRSGPGASQGLQAAPHQAAGGTHRGRRLQLVEHRSAQPGLGVAGQACLGGALLRARGRGSSPRVTPISGRPSAGTQVWSGRHTMSCRRLSTSAFTVQNGAVDMAAAPRLTRGAGTGGVGTWARRSPAASAKSVSSSEYARTSGPPMSTAPDSRARPCPCRSRRRPRPWRGGRR